MRISDWSSDVCSSDLLKEAVYASGVARPKQASALELQQLEQQAMLAAQPQQPMTAQPAAPVGYPDPMAPATMMPGAPAASAPQYEPPAATVSTIGRPPGSGRPEARRGGKGDGSPCRSRSCAAD